LPYPPIESRKKKLYALEEGIKTLNDTDKELIRQECVVILRKDRPPRSNLNQEQLKALKSLRENKDIVILKVDKGDATVVMDQEEYIKRNEGPTV